MIHAIGFKLGLFFLIVGVLSVSTAAFNLDSFFSHPNARQLEARYGRIGARFYYFLLGVALSAVGASLLAFSL